KFANFHPQTLLQLLELAHLKSSAGLNVFEIAPAFGLNAHFLCKSASYQKGFTRSDGFAMLASE
ncbi:MAG TPA: hypothetical protein VFM46_11350, partial [Pseudomonadales bacterium]|nr:hypothetical protein [Pseudomonadales bacterium]